MIACHRSVIAAVSTFFDNALSRPFINKPIVIFGSDVTIEVLKEIVRYAYYGYAEIPSNRRRHFLGICKRYQIEGIEEAFAATEHLHRSPGLQQPTESGPIMITDPQLLRRNSLLTALDDGERSETPTVPRRMRQLQFGEQPTPPSQTLSSLNPKEETLSQLRVGRSQSFSHVEFNCVFCNENFVSETARKNHQPECEKIINQLLS